MKIEHGVVTNLERIDDPTRAPKQMHVEAEVTVRFQITYQEFMSLNAHMRSFAQPWPPEGKLKGTSIEF